MNILVTGANGFIGSNVIKLLSDNINYKFFFSSLTNNIEINNLL